MWDDVMQNVLQNMQEIRTEQRRIREQLESAASAGTKDTDRLIAKIDDYLKRITENTAKPLPPAREPWWRFW